MAEGRSCNECALCCKVFSIARLRKPVDTWCKHCVPGKGGCSIYPERPDVCARFKCGWLKRSWLSLLDPTPVPALTEEWFPARCHFVLWYDSWGCPLVVVDPCYPLAWRSEPFYSAFCAIAGHEFQPGVMVPITIRIGAERIFLGPGGHEEIERCSSRRLKRERWQARVRGVLRDMVA